MASSLQEDIKQATVGEVTSDIPWASPTVRMKFDSFEEVERFIRNHEETNFVKYYTKDSRSVEGARRHQPKRYMSEHLRYATVLFCCIHHGKYRSLSKGLRPCQQTLRKECPAKFRFAITPSGKQLYLADSITEHNHPHNEVMFRSLPQKRRLNKEERDEACQILQKKGKKSVQKHIQEKAGKVLTMRDLHNLAASSHRQALLYKSIQDILDYLSQAEDQSSIVEVVTKPDGTVVGIYYQDQEMKRVYASYPQYLVFDTTCKFNCLHMPLYIMLVEDSNGDYEIVGFFVLILSSANNVQSMVLRFKEHNPSWGEIQVIMAGKDFTGRQVLLEEFPSASVHICLSHMLMSFTQDLSKQKLVQQKEETSYCLKLMKKLAASKSEATYMENYQQLLNTGLQELIKYYNNTWHSNRQEWVEGLKSRSLAIKKEDPDKLDAVHQLLKGVFKNSPTSDQAFANLKKTVELLREERDHSAAALLVQNSPQATPTDSTVDKFQNYLTPYALKYVLRQLKLSWKVKVKTNIDAKSSYVKSSHGVLIVHIDTCPCRFYHSLYLPCRHIFAVRRIKGLPLFAKEVIGSRWSMEHFKSSCRLTEENADLRPDADTFQRRRLNLLSHHEKLTQVSEVMKQLAAVVSEAPGERFCSQIEAVKKLLSCFQNGSSATVIEIGSQDTEGSVAPEETRQVVLQDTVIGPEMHAVADGDNLTS